VTEPNCSVSGEGGSSFMPQIIGRRRIRRKGHPSMPPRRQRGAHKAQSKRI
jgi:hypothetical protein